jgi:hypothetical protein
VQKLASHQIEQAASSVRMFQELSGLGADNRLAATPVASLSNQVVCVFQGFSSSWQVEGWHSSNLESFSHDTFSTAAQFLRDYLPE